MTAMTSGQDARKQMIVSTGTYCTKHNLFKTVDEADDRVHRHVLRHRAHTSSRCQAPGEGLPPTAGSRSARRACAAARRTPHVRACTLAGGAEDPCDGCSAGGCQRSGELPGMLLAAQGSPRREACVGVFEAHTRREVTLENRVPIKPKTISANFFDLPHSRPSASMKPAMELSLTYAAQEDSWQNRMNDGAGM